MPHTNKPLWDVLLTTTAVLASVATLTLTIKAVHIGLNKTREWFADQIEKGAAIKKHE